jgi:hypothetical protein
MFSYFNNQPLQREDYADVAIGVSPYQRGVWDTLRMEYDKADRYYQGLVFQDRVETETGENDAPLLYPVGVNLVKLIALSMTDAFLGEHEDSDPVLFVAKNNDAVTDTLKETIAYLSSVLAFSNAGSLFWETDFSRNLYGASVLRVAPTLSTKPHVRWSKLDVRQFFPIFDPEDPDSLLEAWIVTTLTQDQARIKYGIESKEQFPLKVEKWNLTQYETTIDGKRVDKFSGMNPYGVVPFVYIPRVRTTDWYGESLVSDLFAPQDELNARLADVGDTLNYNSHPVFWGMNMPKGFNSKNFPLAPNAMWDLGRSFGSGGAKPEVGILQAANPVPESAFKHIQFVYDWVRTSSFAPPIAFGEDNGGGQRSGVTLEIRLWPLLKAVRRSRSYMTTGLRRAMYITGKILEQKKWSDIDKRVVAGLLEGELTPQYHHVLPRDQAAVVDEVVKLLSTNPPAISLETAQEELGRGMSEVTRIISMMADHPEWFQKAVDLMGGPKAPASSKEQSNAKSEGAQNKDGGKDEVPTK